MTALMYRGGPAAAHHGFTVDPERAGERIDALIAAVLRTAFVVIGMQSGVLVSLPDSQPTDKPTAIAMNARWRISQLQPISARPVYSVLRVKVWFAPSSIMIHGHLVVDLVGGRFGQLATVSRSRPMR